jgi:colanic acid/amylovoran biosynthesis protein
MKVYLTGHNNFGNRGCEALVRSTVAVLRNRFPQARFLVPTLDEARDRRQWPDAEDCAVRFVPAIQAPARFIAWSRLCSRFSPATYLPWPAFAGTEPFLEDLRDCDAVLSIGGDNYSLDYDLASLALFVAIAEAAIDRGKPVVLWGASVGPFTAMPGVERRMVRHLRRLHAITVRERLSADYLASLGLTATVHQVVDTAFALPRQATEVFANWPATGTKVLGFNMSPLIGAQRKHHAGADDLVAQCASFIREAASEHGLRIVLVPHVAPLDPSADTSHSDEAFLARLACAVGQGVQCDCVPPGLNAAQLKDVIARCDYFIGARTHATIAALSSAVPTLSISYSVKARGINLDLFGHEDFVLAGHQVDRTTLARELRALIERGPEARLLLQQQNAKTQLLIARSARLLDGVAGRVAQETEGSADAPAQGDACGSLAAPRGTRAVQESARHGKFVVMLGPHLDSPGGMSAVARAYDAGGLFRNRPVRYLATYRHRAITDRLRIALLAWLRFIGWALTGQVSAVHANVAARGSFWRKTLFLLTAQLCGARTIFHLHDGTFAAWYRKQGMISRAFVRWVLRTRDLVIVLTAGWREAIHAIEPDARIAVLGNPVETPKQAPSPVEGEVLFLARLRKEKGLDDLLAAAASLVGRFPALRLILAGDGDVNGIRERVRESGLSQHVTLAGWVDGADKQELLQRACVFVLPSYDEGLPMGVLEAMAHAVPVVASRVGGIPEALGDEAGLMFDAGDVGALTHCLAILLEDAELRHRLGDAGKRRAAALFDQAKVLRQLENLYAEMGIAVVRDGVAVQAGGC